MKFQTIILVVFSLLVSTVNAQVIESPFTPEPVPAQVPTTPKYFVKSDFVSPGSYTAVYTTISKKGPYRPYNANDRQLYSTSPPSVFTPGANINKLIQADFTPLKNLVQKRKNSVNNDKVALVRLVLDQDGNIAADVQFLDAQQILDMISVQVNTDLPSVVNPFGSILGAPPSE